jgi:TPR repeat protein
MRLRKVIGLLVLAPGVGFACGWWGDGESDGTDGVVTVAADGSETRAGVDPMRDPVTMVRLGNGFRTGNGPPRDFNLALHWYRLAAERGHPGGQYNLARMYEHGLGVRRDDAEAARWYLRAAEQDEVHSQHHLAEMYREGRGVPRDARRSLAWFEAAAGQGHYEVFPDLAAAYQQGQGTAVDLRRAYLWWWLAAAEGDAAAAERLAELRGRLEVDAVAGAEAEGRALRSGWTSGS